MDVATERKRSRKRPRVEPKAEGGAPGPYPQHKHPTVAEVRAVHDGLASLHPEVIERVLERKSSDNKREGGCGLRRMVLDALVGTVLSQNTTDVNSRRAFASLKDAFPTWEEVHAAPASELEESIRQGGLAATKSKRIKAILDALIEERGELSLEHLRDLSDDDVKTALRRFNGVGAKTVSCVLLFCLGRADFPVDTHVWKIALALNWVPNAADRDGTYAHLNRRVPAAIKYEMHVLLVEHGKVHKNGVAELKKMASAVSEAGASSGERHPAPAHDGALEEQVKAEAPPVKVD